jgi:hypothetical protein
MSFSAVSDTTEISSVYIFYCISLCMFSFCCTRHILLKIIRFILSYLSFSLRSVSVLDVLFLILTYVYCAHNSKLWQAFLKAIVNLRSP